MAKNKNQQETEEKKLTKGKAQFEVVGEVGKIGDWTYKIDEKSDSGYLYSSVQLNINVADNNAIRVEAMGGFFPNSTNNVVRVRSKETNDRFEIDWDDRKNETILDSVSDFDFITVALEKDVKGNLFYKKFLTWYDAVDYVKDHLEAGMVVKVKGNLAWSEYNDVVKARKNIQSIYITTAKPEEYHATFVQAILLDSDALDKSHAKEDRIIDVNAKIVDYDKQIKKQRPYEFNFKFKLDEGNEKACLAVMNKFLTVPKNVIRELYAEGNIIEGAEVGTVSIDDISDELKDLIECGIYSEEEVLGKMAVKGDKVVSLYIKRPYFQKDKEGVAKVYMDDTKYTAEDLFVTADEEPSKPTETERKEEKKEESTLPFNVDEPTDSESDLSWMAELD